MTWVLATIAVLLVAYAAFSRRLQLLSVSGAMFFVTAGLLAGPVLGLLDLRLESEQVKLVAEIIGLPLTVAAGTLVGALVIPGVSVAEAAVLAVVLACTDAALGQAVLTDERIPSRVRQGLNVESGLNDGLCVPIFFIAIALAEADAGTSSGHAATNLVLEQIGYGLLGGIPAGIVGALALRFSARRGLIEPHWMQILTVASALLAAGIASALGGSIFIAAFSGGFVFGALRQDAGGHVSELVDEGGELFDAATFIVFGAVVLGPVLDELTWQVVLYAVLSLTVGRMLPVALALLGTGPPRDGGVPRLFGARGLASIVFAVILIDDADLPHLRTLVVAIAATIALSVYVHGLTANPLTERYVRWWTSHPRDAHPAMESVPAGEHRAGPGG
jgi:sodium/hydrogen antiporter